MLTVCGKSMKEKQVDLGMVAMYCGTFYAIRKGGKYFSSFFQPDNFQANTPEPFEAVLYTDKEAAAALAVELGAEVEELEI